MTEKYGFVYLWFDRKWKRYYIGCRWGHINDGYICSSRWMMKSYKRRPNDFKRRILKTNILDRTKLLEEEYVFLSRIKNHELKTKYYNLSNHKFEHWANNDKTKATIGQKISVSKTGKKVNFSDPVARGKAISAGKKGKTVFSEEHREKLRAAKLGKKLSSEHRAKVIQTLKYYK